MNILIGLSFGLVLFLCLCVGLFVGYKLGHRQDIQLQSEQEIEALRKRNEGFNNIFDYDYNVALGKKVNK